MRRNGTVVGILIGLLAQAPVAVASLNTVPSTKLVKIVIPITPNTLKPTECASITLTSLSTGTGSFSGTTGADLMLGGPNADTPSGGNGDDCLVGGGGNDSLKGGNGADVCVGGPGTDTFNSCETQVQ